MIYLQNLEPQSGEFQDDDWAELVYQAGRVSIVREMVFTSE